VANDEGSTCARVNPLYTRVALWLMLLHVVALVALTIWMERRHAPGTAEALYWSVYNLVVWRLVSALPYVAIVLSVITWVLKKEQRVWKDTALIVLTFFYTFILAPVIHYFAAFSILTI